ncbi:MAG: BrnA antitoxin family protein [Bdellovibrionota bacterium]
MPKKNELHYGKKDFIEGDLSPQSAKVKVTIYLDGDLLLEVRRKAKKLGKKYQTLINESLREKFLGDKASVNPEDFKELSERVALLEKAVSSD